MKLALKLAAAALGLVGAAWLVFAWFEADLEIRVLCSEFHAGMEREHVVHILETGEHLRYRTEAGTQDARIFVDSLYNLGASSCLVEFAAGSVVSSTYSGGSDQDP